MERTNMLILNDIHIGFNRIGGTTPMSREAMRTYLFDSLRETLNASTDTSLMILGDLFDDFEVSPRDWIQTYVLLSNWAAAKNLGLVAGNHDHSARGNKVSSFEMLALVLKQEYPDSVNVIGIDQWDGNQEFVVLAHCSNQDVFDAKLKEILGLNESFKYLLLHANFDNNFAAQSDHSLNVSREMAAKFIERGVKLVFAHEHQARREMDGNVIVLGNQWPTSISDCLNNSAKYAHLLDDGEIQKVMTWHDNDSAGYIEVEWTDLSTDTGAKFIRVVGEASAAQSSEVINKIAKFRQSSYAFVVSNAVKIDGIVAAEELPEAFEATKKFDVLDFVRKHLDADEYAVVEDLLDIKHSVQSFEDMEA